VVNGHSFILIRQMAALARCGLAEVCTVAVLLVSVWHAKCGLVVFVSGMAVVDVWNV